MCHAECYNRSTTEVFALDVGEPPSPMQIRTGYNAYLHDYVNNTTVVADGKETVFIDSVKSKILVLSENDTMLRCLDCSFYVREPSAMIAYEDDCYIFDYMPIQASQSVDSYQHPSDAFLHPDYHDHSKTGVFALSGGESPTDVHRGANSSLFTTAIPRKRTQYVLFSVTLYFRSWFYREQVYSPRFELVGQFGVAGRAQGHLWHPCRVAVTESQRYAIFTPNGHFVRTIPLHNCVNITSVVADGNEIVVIDSVTSKIVVVSEDGRMLHCLDCSFYVREPSAMIAYKDDYYICNYKSHSAAVIDKENKYKKSIGGEGLFDYPSGMETS
ncbi:hypothetical protein Aperf_G00000090002 [Anoplocephala perfoliata]